MQFKSTRSIKNIKCENGTLAYSQKPALTGNGDDRYQIRLYSYSVKP